MFRRIPRRSLMRFHRNHVVCFACGTLLVACCSLLVAVCSCEFPVRVRTMERATGTKSNQSLPTITRWIIILSRDTDPAQSRIKEKQERPL